jgi:hypothetical protein
MWDALELASNNHKLNVMMRFTVVKRKRERGSQASNICAWIR